MLVAFMLIYNNYFNTDWHPQYTQLCLFTDNVHRCASGSDDVHISLFSSLNCEGIIVRVLIIVAQLSPGKFKQTCITGCFLSFETSALREKCKFGWNNLRIEKLKSWYATSTRLFKSPKIRKKNPVFLLIATICQYLSH